MSDLHPMAVSAQDPKLIEAVGPQFIKEGLIEAQKKSWQVFSEIRNSLKTGMTEIEGQKLALEIFKRYGVTQHWHRPQIRFGSGTALTYYEKLRDDYNLRENDLVYFDLGPVWRDEKTGLNYEGDVGDTFVFGENPKATPLIEATHLLFEKGLGYWQQHHPTGVELYRYLNQEASSLGFSLMEKIDGHRVSDYPHTQFSKQRLSLFHHVPKDTLWVLEFQLLTSDRTMGSFFEDLLLPR